MSGFNISNSESAVTTAPPYSCTHTATGDRVYLSLKGTVYANNSVIPIAEIETSFYTGLQCITDRRPCCANPSNRAGEWYFPDGTIVPTQGRATSFYRTRGDDGTVNLNRLHTNIFMPTGLFCCEIPDDIDVEQRLCINISEQKMLMFSYYHKLSHFSDIIVQVSFHFKVNESSDDICFSLTCNSTGGEASGVVWTRDGFLLDNTNPLVITNASTFSYSSVLMVSDRAPGTYTCTIRGTNDQDLSSANFTVHGMSAILDSN